MFSVLPREVANTSISGGTLIAARWIAIAGQAATILISHFALNLDLPLYQCFACILASVAVNCLASLRRGSLSAHMAALYIAFDILQLSALLYLTGGMSNPFFMLLLWPVAIGATLLSLRQTLLLTLLTLISLILLAHFHLPLNWRTDATSSPHNIFLMGGVIAFSITLVFAALSGWRTSNENRAMQQAKDAALSSLARRRQLNALGAQAAAAAHELGSPLSTIAVIARDMADQMDEGSPFYKDAQLLLSQTARCQTIFQKFGQQQSGGDTLYDLIQNLLNDFQYENPAINFGITGTSNLMPDNASALAHALGVFIQSAFQFAKSKIIVDLDDNIIRISDDGPGFSPEFLAKAGKPYASTRAGNANKGLGIFIALNLLNDRSAKTFYINNNGAVVTISL